MPIENVIEATPENYIPAIYDMVQDYRETNKINMLLDNNLDVLLLDILRGFFCNISHPERRNIVYSAEMDYFYMLINGRWIPVEISIVIQFIRPLLKAFNDELISDNVEFPLDISRKEDYIIKRNVLERTPLHKKSDREIIEALKNTILRAKARK